MTALIASLRYSSYVFILIGLLSVWANGQSLVASTGGEVILHSGLEVPGVPGSFFWGGVVSVFDPGRPWSCSMDERGDVLVTSHYVSAINGFSTPCLVHVRTLNDLSIIARPGDPAPGLPGLTIDRLGGAGATSTNPWVAGGPRLSSDGKLMFTAHVMGPGVNATNNSALFGGNVGSLGLIVREGDALPGTLGGNFFFSPASLRLAMTRYGSSGRILLKSGVSYAAPPPTALVTDSGLYTGVAGALNELRREGSSLFGARVERVGSGVYQGQRLTMEMNASGQILYTVDLESNNPMTPSVSPFNDQSLWRWTPGIGNELVWREGDMVPGMPGFTFGGNPCCDSRLNLTGWGTGTEAVPWSTPFNDSGECVFRVGLLSPAPSYQESGAIFLARPGVMNPLVLDGDLIAGTSIQISLGEFATPVLNNLGEVAFATGLSGPSSSNDSAICLVRNGVVSIVARLGDPVPQVPGALLGPLQRAAIRMNDRGQLIFWGSLMGPNIPPMTSRSLFGYDPTRGLTLLLRAGDSLSVMPGLAGVLQRPHVWGFNQNGDVLIKAGISGFSNATVLIRTNVGSLNGKPARLSAAAGGVHTLTINAGTNYAGQSYLLGGSFTGTSPGVSVGGLTIPLNVDGYFNFALSRLNSFPFAGNFGVLDPLGHATATLTLPPGLTGLSGLTFHHAFTTADSFGALTFVSETASLEIIP